MSAVRTFPVFPGSWDPIRWWARLTPNRVAFVDRTRNRRATYRELDAGADRMAAWLVARGVAPGGRVATLSGNRIEMVELFVACARVGAIFVPLNWRLAAPELTRIIADAGPAIIIGEDRFRGLAEEATAGTYLEMIEWSGVGSRESGVARSHSRLPTPDSRQVATRDGSEHRAFPAEEPLMLLYTSGSTGRPKGALLPRRQFLYNAVATVTGWSLAASDVALVATPMFHTGGWNVFSTPMWHCGGTVVMLDQFDPIAFLDALAEERVTVTFGVPTQLVMLLESSAWGARELAHLRFMISGGAPCPASVAERIRSAGIAFKEGFGLTECGPNCFAMDDAEAPRRPGSVGWPVPFLEMRLAARDGREADVGEPGELLLRGPQMFGGYLNAPDLTAYAVDADGWLHTGDLAMRDEDGAFRICGRRKDMFISGGENVFPGEVEAALSECGGVAEAVVVGVPDAKWGEVGRAFVVARAGATIVPERLLAEARARLAGYKVPKSVVVLDALPRLGSGKTDRKALATSA